VPKGLSSREFKYADSDRRKTECLGPCNKDILSTQGLAWQTIFGA